MERFCSQTRLTVSTCVLDLWSRGHISSVWIQLGCQQADKVSVVSHATGSDQLWASRAVRELRLYILPATDGVCLNPPIHNLLWLAQVVPAVGKTCLAWVLLLGLHLNSTVYSISDLKMHLLCYTEERYSSPTVTDLAQQKHQFSIPSSPSSPPCWPNPECHFRKSHLCLSVCYVFSHPASPVLPHSAGNIPLPVS